MESPFIEVTVVVRPHQVSNLYQFAAQLANDADMEFPGNSPQAPPVIASSVSASAIATASGGTKVSPPLTATMGYSESEKPEPAKQPDGPPQSVTGSVDPTKFSGCRNVNEVVGLLWKDNGIRTVADARVAFDQIRASGECAAAKVVPEDGIDTRITRAIELLQSE